MTETNNPNQEPTKFNMAVATLIRIDHILSDVTFFGMNGNLMNWHKALFELRRNIAPFIKDEEFRAINEQLNLIDSRTWIYKPGREVQVVPGEYTRVSYLLDNLTIIMQRAMKDAGILMPKSSDPRFALED